MRDRYPLFLLALWLVSGCGAAAPPPPCIATTVLIPEEEPLQNVQYTYGDDGRVLTTTTYTGTREQFGTRLAQFQAVKHQLANGAAEIEPSRGLLWYAAHAVDHLPERAPHAAAVAKAHITDRAIGVARDAVELHGGIGYTWESDVQIWFKRVLFDRAWLGAPEVHRERSARLAGW